MRERPPRAAAQAPLDDQLVGAARPHLVPEQAARGVEHEPRVDVGEARLRAPARVTQAGLPAAVGASPLRGSSRQSYCVSSFTRHLRQARQAACCNQR
ncbi:MAG TPA: hypothetical protein VE379_05935, partial [Vicinamibacterales bacterium]|nr:hypothetical protein [Vicinamibacterales bacterium]